MPLVSVIVPVYKVEKYLLRCLDSLCRQSLKDIEILLIDDASPDQCGEICEQYAAKDARFKVIHHAENKGLGAARNTGINQATANYIMFVDSDDWVHEDFCKAPYECAVNYNVDLVMFNFQYVKGTDFCNIYYKNVSTGCKTRENIIEISLKNQQSWNKLYQKELFNDVCFPEGYLYEDIATTYKLFLNASCIYYLDEILYYYNYLRPESISAKKNLKRLRHWFQMSQQLYNDLLIRGYSKEKLDLFFQEVALIYCIKKKKDFSDSYYALSADVLRSIDYIRKNFNWKQTILVRLFQFSPTLFNLTCMLFNKQLD